MSVLATVAVLAGLVAPMLAKIGQSSRDAVCLGNLGAIVRAMTLYAAENQGLVPNAGFGVQSGDNWCFGPFNQGRLPGQPPQMPDASGIASGRLDQEPFRRLGQLWPYLRAESVFYCPEDPLLLRPEEGLPLGRSFKLSSYNANAALSNLGLVPPPLRIDQFLPGDFAFMEPSEWDYFNFNDSTIMPDSIMTQRHGLHPLGSRQVVSLLRGGHVATMGGTVEWMSTTSYREAVAAPRPNRGFCNRP